MLTYISTMSIHRENMTKRMQNAIIINPNKENRVLFEIGTNMTARTNHYRPLHWNKKIMKMKMRQKSLQKN